MKSQDVQDRNDTNPKSRRRAVAKRVKGDELVIKIEESKYSEVLKAMRSDVKLLKLGADVRAVLDALVRVK